MKTFTKTILACWAILFAQYMTAQCSPTEVSFNFTGGLQSWTVPSGVTEITILAAGADGGNFSFPAGPSTLGGNGARITADFNVTPGDQLQIIVAGRGGNHPGLPFIGSGAGGGGATFIASGMGGFGAFNSTSNLLLVAGGGGGAGSAVQGEGSNVESLLNFGLPGLPGIFSVFAAGGGATSINNGQFLPQSANAGGTAAVFGAAGGISNDLDVNPFEVRRVNGGYGGGGAPGGSGGGGGGFSGGSGGPAALTGGFAGTSKSFGSNTVFDPASNNGSGFVRIFYATEDNAPVPNVSSLPSVTAQCEVTSLTAPTATDDCDGTITATRTVSLPITAQGTTVVTWTYTDGGGNTVTQTQNIIINDTTAPTASSLPNVTAQCEVTSLTPPTATDNCEGTITGTTTTSLPITTQGTTVVTWTFNDGNGNSITQNQNIIIEDTIAPTIECPTNIDQDNDIGICGAVITYTTPLEMDNCSGAITTQTAGLPSGSTFQIGTTTNTFVSTDASGNTTTCSFDITINDTEAPIANCAAPFTIQLDANGLANITVADVNNGSTDNCAIESATIDIDTFDCSNVGANSVTLTVTDVNGNTTSCTTMVTVEDLILPELVCQDITITLDENGEATIVAADVIATLTDVCGTPNASVDIDTFSCSDLGTPVLVTVLATDANGNTATCTTTVTVDDLLSPVFVTNTLPIDEVRIVDATGEYILEDFTIDVATTDNCTSPANITVTQNPAAGTPLTPGVYDITLFAIDDLGNETDYMFELTVEEFLGTENITLSLATVLMYPNPARAQVILSNPQAIDLQTANIYDISGRLVKSFDLNGMGAQKLLDLTSLASAKYFVQIMTKNNVIIKQLIKE